MSDNFEPKLMMDRLEEVAEKLGVKVRVEALGEREGTIVFQSGTCILRGKRTIIIDGRLSLNERCKALASELKKLNHSNIFIYPAVRRFQVY